MHNRTETFPFPFKADTYEYSNNSRLLEPSRCIEVTDEYRSEIQLKRTLLGEHPERCYRSFGHTMESQWEIAKLIFQQLSTYYPEQFSFEYRGKEYRFRNKILREEECFVDRNLTTIDLEPLDLVGRHVQEDLILMGDREETLYLDAGQLCFPSNWSLAFAFGLDFKSIHTPVPRINETGFIEKVERFIKRIQPGAAWERNNWSVTITEKLDTPLETFSQWGKKRLEVTEENVAELLHLRVEIQRLYRLPLTNDVLFTIHTHLLSLQDLSTNQAWLKRFYQNIKTLPDDIAEYKGISLYKRLLLTYLEKQTSGNGMSDDVEHRL